MVFVEITLRLPSCEPQAPTVDLKATFLNPAKWEGRAQVRREREGQDSWGDMQQDPSRRDARKRHLGGEGVVQGS